MLKKIVLHQEYALNIVLITLLIYVMKLKEISQVKVFWIIKIVSFSDENLTSDSLNIVASLLFHSSSKDAIFNGMGKCYICGVGPDTQGEFQTMEDSLNGIKLRFELKLN